MTTSEAPEAPEAATTATATGGGSGGGPGGGGTGGGGTGGGGPEAPPHPVLGLARAIDDALDRLGDPPAWSMAEAEQREALLVLDRLASRLTALEMRVLAEAGRQEVGAAEGATSTAAWLAHHTRQTRARCSTAAKLAAELDESFAATHAALSAGRINPDQAAVIVKAVAALTRDHEDLPVGIEARAEGHLLDLAEEFDATVLRRLGRRLFEVVCPEAADAAEGEALRKEEERAQRKAVLSMRDNGDGTVHGSFKLPRLHAALLKKALEALTSPRRLGEARLDPRTGRPLPHENLLGCGFMELLERCLDPATLPSQGGSPFTLVITMGLDALKSGVGAGTLETGERISAGEVRRLACRAGLIPVVLGGDSVVLDLGRRQRLFDFYQRLALAQQFRGCATDGCDRPPSWTEVHHKEPWSEGGRTDLYNGIALCPAHHHMADDPRRWDMRTLPSGQVRFARRQ
jgi:hypothetical protein